MSDHGTIYSLAPLADFARFGLSASARGSSVTDNDVLAAMETASRTIDGYFVQRGWPVPLATYGVDTTRACCILAAADVLVVIRGTSYDDPAGVAWAARAADTVRWLERASAGQVTPTNITTSLSDPTPADGGPEMYSDPGRGWGES